MLTPEQLAEARAAIEAPPCQSGDIIDRYHAVCQYANWAKPLLDDVDALREENETLRDSNHGLAFSLAGLHHLPVPPHIPNMRKEIDSLREGLREALAIAEAMDIPKVLVDGANRMATMVVRDEGQQTWTGTIDSSLIYERRARIVALRQLLEGK